MAIMPSTPRFRMPERSVTNSPKAAISSGVEAVTIPAGAYEGTAEVATIGAANLLLCRPDLPPPLAAALTHVLVGRAARLVPASALGTQFLDVRSLIGTGEVPLHPGAVAAYRELHG